MSVRIKGNAIGATIVTGDGNVTHVTNVFTDKYLLSVDAEDESLGPNPYLGLQAFHEEHAEFYFGRAELVDELWGRFRALHESMSSDGRAPLRVLPVVGPSGSGKSSLARAGLIPRLQREALTFRNANVIVVEPGARPLRSLAGAFARALQPDGPRPDYILELEESFATRDSDGSWGALTRLAAAIPSKGSELTVVLVDQLEEIYSLCTDDHQRNAFVGNLLDAAADPSCRVSVIATFRSDFLGNTHDNSVLNRVLSERVIPFLDREGLRRAVVEPARKAGKVLDDALVDLLLSEASEREGSLPLLQFALTRIWAGLLSGESGAKVLRDIGGVGGALANEAERLYECLTDADKAVAKRVFKKLVRLNPGSTDSRQRVTFDELVAANERRESVDRVLRHFSQHSARLVTLSASADATIVVEITHETIFFAWHRLRNWIAAERGEMQLQQRLAEAAKEWADGKRSEGYLWRAPLFDQLSALHQQRASDFTTVEEEFFRASRRLWQSERRRAQRTRMTVTAVGALLPAAAFFYVRAQESRATNLQESGREVLQRDEAIAGSVFFAEAERTLPPWSTAGRTQKMLQHRAMASLDALDLVVPANKAGVTGMALDRSGERLLTYGPDGVAAIWDARTLQHRLDLNTTGAVTWAAFNPDGRYVVTCSQGDTMNVWDAATGMVVATDHKVGAGIRKGVFGADQELLTWSLLETKRWRLPDLAPLDPPLGGSASAAFDTVRSNFVVVQEEQPRVSVPLPPMEPHVLILDPMAHRSFDLGRSKDLGEFVAVSPDSSRIVVVGTSTGGHVWSATDGSLLRTFANPFAPGVALVSSVFFSPDGKKIVIVKQDGQIATCHDYGDSYECIHGEGHPAAPLAHDFSRDGRFLLVAYSDGAVVISSASTGARLGVLHGQNAGLEAAVFAASDDSVLTADDEGYVRRWKLPPNIADAVAYDWFQGDGKSVTRAGARVEIHGNAARIVEASTGRILTDWGGAGHREFSTRDGKRTLEAGSEFVLRDGVTRRIVAKLSAATLHDVVAVSPIGSRVATYHCASAVPTKCMDAKTTIWDAETGAQLRSVESGSVQSLAFSPDGKKLATGEGFGDYLARVWEVETGESRAKIPGFGYAKWVEFSADGRELATVTSHGAVKVWDLVNLGPARFSFHPGGGDDSVDAAHFNPDGSRLLTVGAEFAIWDLENGGLIGKIDAIPTSIRRTGVFSHDGRWIATTGTGVPVRLWDAETGDALGTFGGDELSWSAGLAFTPDDNYLVDSRTSFVALWDLRSETRSSREIDAIVRCRSPLRLEDGRLYPQKSKPTDCPDTSDVTRVANEH